MRDGEVVKMIERWQIEGREPHDIAADLAQAMDQYCAKTVA
jgi:putative YphP/YqiW family bacilliredoxin